MSTVEAIRVRERPILFSAAMVAAILDNRKSQTRRIVKFPKLAYDPPHDDSWIKAVHQDGMGNWIAWSSDSPDLAEVTKELYPNGEGFRCPFGVSGEHLWVKEAWQTDKFFDKLSPNQIAADCLDAGYDHLWCPVQYADGKRNVYWESENVPGRKRNALHMPRWASRISLEITGIRVEMLQDISDEDCAAEMGYPLRWTGEGPEPYKRQLKLIFSKLWNSLHPTPPFDWQSCPWVFVIEFRRIS